MEPYRYCVTLRINHPNLDPELISKTLNLEPYSVSKVGDIKTTPKGQKLNGVWAKSHWSHLPHGEEKLSSDTLYLEDYLANLTAELNVHKEFFSMVAESGGNINYFVGVFSEHSIGHSFPAILLKNISSLNIDLELDIYAYPEST